jgi:hypothetical protein
MKKIIDFRKALILLILISIISLLAGKKVVLVMIVQLIMDKYLLVG